MKKLSLFIACVGLISTATFATGHKKVSNLQEGTKKQEAAKQEPAKTTKAEPAKQEPVKTAPAAKETKATPAAKETKATPAAKETKTAPAAGKPAGVEKEKPVTPKGDKK